MHEKEIDISVDLVRDLLADQFPELSARAISRVESPGTDNTIFRIGDDIAARFPRIDWAVGDAEREHRWLPHLSEHLPVATPRPLGLGAPGHGYPWSWLVVEWLPGQNAYDAPPKDTRRLAMDLAAFVKALHGIDATSGPPRDAPHARRGRPLETQDEAARSSLAALHHELDVPAATGAWNDALTAPKWTGRPTWIHGDLQATNLLLVDDRLTAVIDYGGLGVGDPAADMIPAWALFDARDREVFKDAVGVDEATWARGKGWALSVGLIALPYYLHTNPVIVAWARQSIHAVLRDRYPR